MIKTSEIPVKDLKPNAQDQPSPVQPAPYAPLSEPPSTEFQVISSPKVVWPVFSRAEFLRVRERKQFLQRQLLHHRSRNRY